MKVPVARVVGIGDVTPWGRHFFESLQGQNLIEVAYVSTVQEYLKMPGATQPQIVMLENSPDSQHCLLELRKQSRKTYAIWFGKIFSKEDLSFALEHRVYAVFENLTPESKQVSDAIRRLSGVLDRDRRYDLLVRSLKSVLLQAEGDVADSVMSELKTAVAKLGSTVSFSEFAEASGQQVPASESKLLFHQSEGFAEALETIDSLERTGVLWVKGALPYEEGRVEFLQGKIVWAASGVVSGLKALYRMFLWDEPQFLFTRRDAEEMVLHEPINAGLKHISAEGADLKRRYDRIRQELPPNELTLELDPSFLHNGVSLPLDEFSTLASVVEFGKVANVLDYNPLPDAILLEGLISLKKQSMIRIGA